MVLVPKSKAEPAPHHKKRYGRHRKHTKPYTRAYSPYLPLLAIVAVGALLNVFWMQGHSSSGQVLGASTTNSAIADLLTATNNQRSANNEDQLRLSDELSKAAQAKADDMAQRNYWSHATPDGKQPWTFIQASGYDYQLAGENLAYGFSGGMDVVKGWMNSPEHRANILNAGYQDVGFGIAKAAVYQGDAPQTIVVSFYADPTGGSNPAQVKPETPNTPNMQLTRLDLVAGNTVPGALLAVITVSAAAAGWFIVRHMRFIHRALNYSEAYIVRHRRLDLVLVVLAVAGILLTRSAGFIH